MSRPDLLRLSKPFPPQFVAQKEGASYVNHAIVQQRLLGTLGPFSMRVDHIIRGPYDEKVTGRGERQRTWPARTDAVVGVVLTCTFTIDEETVEVSEVGTPEGYYMAPHDGERLKKAMSDALKRCAMRVGVGLDLWSKGAYVLPAMLEHDVDPETGEVPAPDHDAPDPDDLHADVRPTDPGAATEEAGDRSGGDGPRTSPPASSDSVDWEGYAAEVGVTKAMLLTTARRVATDLGVPAPTSLGGIESGSPLHAKLLEATS